MQIHLLVPRSLLFSSLLLLSPFSTHAQEQQPTQAPDKQLKGAVIVPPKDRMGDVSPGAVEDVFKACLARIPENASVGQRMLAELTCQREEETRKTYQRAPQF
jgi:hypothetical protein